MSHNIQEPWPALSADDFKKTSHLLYMGIQAIGKLMLTAPFTPHWANLAMPLTSRGITTGVIPYLAGTFSVDMDFTSHQIIFSSSWGQQEKIPLKSMSVAELTNQIFDVLNRIDVQIKINQLPQEMSNPIPFNEDKAPRIYDEKIVNTWWRILSSTNRVLLIFHSRFYGITPSVGLCWGTLDLRDARYKGLHLPIAKEMENYIARNSFDDAQVEVGFSCSNEKYLVPSFFAFAYPKPQALEHANIKPDGVKWIAAINEFVLDYETLRKSKNPDDDLLLFFESYYQAVAKLDSWDPTLIVAGEPV
jgi:hypothetical protein